MTTVALVLSNRIKSLRENLKITQKELAEQLGMSLSGLRKIEYGEREPNLNTLINIAKIFEVTTDYLLGIEKTSKTFNEREFEVMKAKNNMLMSDLQYERFRAAEPEFSTGVIQAKQQLDESRGYYCKTLFTFMVDYFYQDNPNPYNSFTLKNKFPLTFVKEKDIFDGISINILCADGTEINRIVYYSDNLYHNTEERADRWIKKYKKHFMME